MQLLDSILRDLDLLPDDPPPSERPEQRVPDPPPRAVVPPATPPPSAPPAPATGVVRVPTPPPSDSVAPEGEASPYLEERLAAALRAIAQVREEMRDMALRSQTVRDTVGSVEVDLERSVRELEFLRAEQARTPRPPVPLPARASRPAPAAGRGPAAATGRYAEFTVDRYNRTMTRVKGRRRRMARWMVVLATLLSVGLVGVDLLFPNPQPAWWLGILPAVWMIPVPFFALSFRGTQRVLRRNHFDLAGEG